MSRFRRFVGWSCLRLGATARSALRRRDLDFERVAVICDTFHRYGMAQAVGLAKSGRIVTCFYVDRMNDFGDHPDDRAQLIDWARSEGVEMVPIPRRRLLRLPQQIAALHKAIRSRRIARVVVQPHIDPRIATIALAHWTIFVLHDPRPHTGDSDSHFPLPVRLITRFAEHTAAAIMLHSDRLIPQVPESLRSHPLVVVPHGASVAPRAAPRPSIPNILLAGRVMAYKGFDTALEAFPSVRRSVPSCTLTVAGTGPLAEVYAGERRDGVDVLPRYIPERELDHLLEMATVVVLPYRDATQSGVGLLAVARGIPVVVSSAGALPDLVPPDAADRIVEPGDAPGLARSIVSVLDADSEPLREDALHFARSRFDWPVAGEALSGRLEELDPRPTRMRRRGRRRGPIAR